MVQLYDVVLLVVLAGGLGEAAHFVLVQEERLLVDVQHLDLHELVRVVLELHEVQHLVLQHR